MLKVWGRRSSLNVQKVLWLMEELWLPHQHVDVGGRFGGLDSPQFRQLNPNALVPVLEDGDLAVWESHAILRYLAARYGQGRFWNNDAGVQSLADRWMDWAQTALQPAFLTGVFWGYYRTPEPQRDWRAINAALDRSAQLFGMLNEVLADRLFLAGEHLTLADIPAGSNLYRYFELDIERPPLPHVEAWYRRLQERQAYRRHVMAPFDELKGRLAF